MTLYMYMDGTWRGVFRQVALVAFGLGIVRCHGTANSIMVKWSKISTLDIYSIVLVLSLTHVFIHSSRYLPSS
jgi:hypothetical protein